MRAGPRPLPAAQAQPRATPWPLPRAQALGCQLLCWDVGGAAGLRGIWSKYYGECHALVFVVDAADRQRLDEAKAALDRALGGRGAGGSAPAPRRTAAARASAACLTACLRPASHRPARRPRPVRRAAAGARQQARLRGGGIAGGAGGRIWAGQDVRRTGVQRAGGDGAHGGGREAGGAVAGGTRKEKPAAGAHTEAHAGAVTVASPCQPPLRSLPPAALGVCIAAAPSLT